MACDHERGLMTFDHVIATLYLLRCFQSACQQSDPFDHFYRLARIITEKSLTMGYGYCKDCDTFCCQSAKNIADAKLLTIQDYQRTRDGYAIAYTDGSCLYNGKIYAAAGIGIWFGYNHPM